MCADPEAELIDHELPAIPGQDLFDIDMYEPASM